MQLRYDDDFLEGAVFLRANSQRLCPPPAQVRRFHREREKLYSVLDPDERNTAFFKLHLDWFREWEMEKSLIRLVSEFPLFQESLKALAFRKARIKADEGAELYVSQENGEIGVVALRVERFEEPKLLEEYLTHEFTHVYDMINPAFGYSRLLHLPNQNAAQQRLTRERYRLFWDITIDGRLADSGRAASGSLEMHRAAFDTAFSFWPTEKRDAVFDQLWNAAQPRHQELLSLASDPRDLKSASQASPGAPCPLCGFATFAWADTRNLGDQTTTAIQKEFPQWSADQGACGRCAQIYGLSHSKSLATA